MRLLLSLLLTVSFLGACTKAPKESTQQTGNKAKLTTEQKQKLESDLTGRWVWQAKKNNKLIGMGEFDLQDKKGEIKGVTKTLITGLKAIPGKGGNSKVAAAILVFPLQGKRDGKDKLKFEVKDDKGQVTKNQATVKNGLLMEGTSNQQLSSEESKLLGNKGKSVIEYSWTAVRLSTISEKGKK